MTSLPTIDEAELVLGALAESFLATSADFLSPGVRSRPNQSDDMGGLDYESRYKALIEHIPGIVFVAPLQFGKGDAYVSPQIESILGFKTEEWLEDPLRWYQQVHPEDKERWSIEAASLFLSAQPLSSSYRVIARNGRVVWFQCDARMVHSSDGKPSFIHGIGFDVTELKEAEASLTKARNDLETRVAERTDDLARTNTQLNQEIVEHKRTESLLIAAKEAAEASARVKSEFMANMSHEIRTPMNGVLGLTNLVLNTELTAEQRKYLVMARSSAQSLLSIINQILDFSKLESGKTELQSAEFPLRTSMEELTDELRCQADLKGLKLACEIAPEIPDLLVGDAGRLRQVLTNLIGNAIKFTQSGDVTLRIATNCGQEVHGEEDQKLSCVLEFSVTDTGIGISPDAAKAIFEPFVQADGSITRKYGGTGLGLSISKELVGMMGGAMNVTSAAGSGSTFSFTARLAVATQQKENAGPDTAKTKVRDSSLTTDTPERRPLRVLVAEDNLVNQIVVSGVLKAHGHAVTLANNGREAVKAHGESSFDIILMDVQMPIMDGFSAVEAIRAKEVGGGCSHLPIIGLSAHALEADRTKCIEAGMDGYLSKPYNGADLISLITALTSRSAVRQQ